MRSQRDLTETYDELFSSVFEQIAPKNEKYFVKTIFYKEMLMLNLLVIEDKYFKFFRVVAINYRMRSAKDQEKML